ncbi:hypothetical protein [Methyloglobulus sp.]|uniref:hypothetical protein n=1 Tax=Methyloglobulus sp. TaxID=2518622 RepID=UPI0032B86170
MTLLTIVCIDQSKHDNAKAALNADVYFTHPYNSWERGLNENTNGLTGSTLPKAA